MNRSWLTNHWLGWKSGVDS